MNKRLTARQAICVILAVALSFSFSASAAPGQNLDPVVTLDYLENVFLKNISDQTEAKAREAAALLNEHIDELLAALESTDPASRASFEAAQAAGRVLRQVNLYAQSPTTISLPKNAVLTLAQGSVLTVLNGTSNLGAKPVLDSHTARDTSAYQTLPAGRRYLVCENGTSLTVHSDEAQVVVQGAYAIDLPPEAAYTDIWNALVQMRLINTEELGRYGVRLEMFIVVLAVSGLRETADQYHTTHPFNDLTWGDSYVAYLYDKGYTKGTGTDTFSPAERGTLQQMCVLLMRLLGYSEGEEFAYNTALDDAVKLGLFSQAEIETLSADGFRRDDMMYVAFYALGMPFKGTNETVLDRLITSGWIRSGEAAAAINAVTRVRP